jgi:hypothetical protein
MGQFPREAIGDDTHSTGQVLRAAESLLGAHGIAVDVMAVNADKGISLISLNTRDKVTTSNVLESLLHIVVGALGEPPGNRQFPHFT